MTIAIISSVSFVSRQIRKASTSANCLNNAALPSMTGMAALGPISPSPSTAVPSLTTATEFFLIVYSYALSWSAAIAWHTLATPGVYTLDKSSMLRIGFFKPVSSLPPTCIFITSSIIFITVPPVNCNIFFSISFLDV
ncbi:hypothetical protein D3C76_1380010 [compost metagenome]